MLKDASIWRKASVLVSASTPASFQHRLVILQTIIIFSSRQFSWEGILVI